MNKIFKALIPGILACVIAGAAAWANYAATAGSGLTFQSFDNAGVKSPGFATVDSTGVDATDTTKHASKIGMSSGAVSSGAYASGSFASGSFASGSVASGAMVDLGAQADSAWVSGSGSVIAILKNIATNVASAIAAGTNYIGQVGLNATTTGGWTPNHLVAANSNNATNLKASAGIVHAVQGYGVGSAPAYIKLYDKASAPTCGSDTPVKVIMIPAAATAANGAGAVSNVIDVQFSTGIGFCIVTGITNADNTSVAASTFLAEIDWK